MATASTASMPSDLLHIAVNSKHGLRRWFVSVVVELRSHREVARIIEAREGGLTGGSK